jgi:hypothetical protein
MAASWQVNAFVLDLLGQVRRVPARLFDDADELQTWVERAVAVGMKTRKRSAR